MTESAQADVAPPTSGRLDTFFGITRRGSTVGTEIRGGFATFFTMAYIVVLNPLIIGTAKDVTGATLGVPQVAAVTALVAGLMTILMGVIGRYPLAIAAGLGLNTFVAVTLARQMTWAEAMGLIVLEGLIITVLVLTGLRKAVLNAIPTGLKAAIAVGIGMFLAFIGFVDSGIVRRLPDAAGTTVPVGFGIDGRLAGWPTLVFVFGLLLIAVLMARKVRGAILIGIVAATALAVVIEAVASIGPAFSPDGVNPRGWSLVTPAVPSDIVATPDLGLLGQFSLFGALSRIGFLAVVLALFTLILTDFFDTMGTVVAVAEEGGMLDEKGELPGVERVLLVDSLAAVAGGAASASSNTVYIESAAGVGEGARTGLASVVTGLLFLVAMVFTPLVTIVPFEAATPALVIVGFLIMAQVKQIDFSDIAMGFAAFLAITVMPFTYSITNGIGAAFVAFVLLRAVQGRAREVSPLLWGVSALFVVYFLLDPISTLLGL